MPRTGRMSEGAEQACGRLDALVRMAGPELGRWVIAVAEGYADGSGRQAALSAPGGRVRPAAHRPSAPEAGR
jgi:hypothetical protein